MNFGFLGMEIVTYANVWFPLRERKGVWKAFINACRSRTIMDFLLAENALLVLFNANRNVGDIGGAGSNIFSSCVAHAVAFIFSFGIHHKFTLMRYHLLISSVGILVCVVVILFATNFLEPKTVKEIEPSLKNQLFISTMLMIGCIAVVSGVAPLDFEAQLDEDTIVHMHHPSLDDTLLEQHLCMLEKTFSMTEIAPNAELVGFPIDHNYIAKCKPGKGMLTGKIGGPGYRRMGSGIVFNIIRGQNDMELDLHYPLFFTNGKAHYQLPEQLQSFKLVFAPKLKPFYLVALLSNVAAFAISLFSIWASEWEAIRRQPFGFFRVKILGAWVSIQMIWLLAGILIYETIARLIHDTSEVQRFLMFQISALGLLVNTLMADGAVPSLKTYSERKNKPKNGAKEMKQCNKHVQSGYILILGNLIQNIGDMVVEQAFWWFKQMKSLEIKPSEVVSLAILMVCFHVGEVDQGLHPFDMVNHEVAKGLVKSLRTRIF